MTYIILFLIIISYIYFPKIHFHEIVIEELKILNKQKKGKLQLLIFYLIPILLWILFFFYITENEISTFDKNIGNYVSIISIFCGFLLNISVFLDTILSKIIDRGKVKDKQEMKEISREVNVIVNYTLLVGFIFLILCIIEIFFGVNKYIVVFIITFGIHFFIGIMMVYRVIYILTRNTY